MIREVKANKTLLINGPASVRLVSGEAEILGAPLGIDEKIIIRNGKRTPFYVKKEATFDITHIRDPVIEEAEGNTIPASWLKVAEETLVLKKPTVIMIMGEVDSGKTSLCTFLANTATKAKRSVAVIDADLGQSDIGPAATIGLAYINRPIKDFFNLQADDIYFVGLTSPSGAVEHVVRSISDFKTRVLQRNRDFLVINTDGWVEGEEAAEYKSILTETIAPSAVIGIEQEKELTPILSKLKKPSVLIVEPSTAVKKRDRERRKTLRELSYKKYLKNVKVEAFPLSWIKIEGMYSSQSLFLTNERLKKIETVLGIHPAFCEETVEAIWIVLRRNQRLSFEKLQKAEEAFKKKIQVMQNGDERGLIVGLHDAENKFLGLGIISSIDYNRKVMKVSTPVTKEVVTIRVGRVKLDDEYQEVDTAATLWS